MPVAKVLVLPFGGVPTSAKTQPHGCKAAANAFFRAVAKGVGLSKDQFTLRYNASGDWGETTFHTDTVYMHVHFDKTDEWTLGLLGRTCQGRTDFSGGPNQWLSVRDATLEAVIAFYQQLDPQAVGFV